MLIGLQEEIWREVRSPLWRCMARFRTLGHPASRDHRRVHWASAKGRQSWAILSLLMKKINDDKAWLSHGKENTELLRRLTAWVLDAKMGVLKKYSHPKSSDERTKAAG